MGKWILVGLLGLFCACCFGESNSNAELDPTQSVDDYGYKQFENMESGNSFLGTTETNYQSDDPFIGHSRNTEDVNPFTGDAETLGGDSQEEGQAQENSFLNPETPGEAPAGNGFFSEYEKLSSEYWQETVDARRRATQY